jgi:thioredoxin 1
MRKIILSVFFLFSVFLTSCSVGQQNNTVIDAQQFAENIKSDTPVTILDVRTPQEFSEGHIENAINMDWNSQEFEKLAGKLNQSIPVYVYCLSGGRSHAAAQKLHEMGFKQIRELKGGMMTWRNLKLPETKNNAQVSKGLTQAEFEKLINQNQLVLVDYYAEWCMPCKKMKPALEEISNEMKGKVEIIRINVDQNQELTNSLNIQAIPVLQLYKQNKKVWENTGYIEKPEIIRQINMN